MLYDTVHRRVLLQLQQVLGDRGGANRVRCQSEPRGQYCQQTQDIDEELQEDI